MKINKIITASILSFGLFLLVACDEQRVFDENKVIESGTWPAEQAYGFDVKITDTLNLNNIYINIRNAGDYGYSNLFLFVRMTFPDKKVAADTLECTLADDAGKWLGSGLGDIKENSVLYKPKVRFPKAGIYHFDIIQGMRVEKLKGILDIGVRVEKAQ